MAVIAVLAGITIGYTSDIQQKAQIEQTAGEIRDFFIEAGALAAKTQQDVYIGIDDQNHKLFAYYRLNSGDTHERNWRGPRAVRNFEGGGSKCVDLSHMDASAIRCTSNRTQLFIRKQDDGSLILSNSLLDHAWFIFTPRRIAYIEENFTKFCFIRRGRYSAIIEIAGTGNMNTYISKKGSQIEFYPAKI